MTLWDQIKSTFNSDPDRPDDEKLTAAMWNQHVEDGHFPADKLNAGVDGNGYPIWTDPANGDVVVWRYEPGTGIVPAEGLKLATAMDANGNDINNVGALEADSGTVDSKEIPGYGTSTSGVLSFGDWETVSADRPARLSLTANVKTDGTTSGYIKVEVDESGGTSSDYDMPLALASFSLGAASRIFASREVTLPPGASYRVVNETDPTGGNTFELERIFEL